mgnify:CR=1 FL=1
MNRTHAKRLAKIHSAVHATATKNLTDDELNTYLATTHALFNGLVSYGEAEHIARRVLREGWQRSTVGVRIAQAVESFDKHCREAYEQQQQ